jgi:hypothetical protein
MCHLGCTHLSLACRLLEGRRFTSQEQHLMLSDKQTATSLVLFHVRTEGWKMAVFLALLPGKQMWHCRTSSREERGRQW